MQITDVRVRKLAKEGKMKAVVSITWDDQFVVHDIKVIEGEKYIVQLSGDWKGSEEFIFGISDRDTIGKKNEFGEDIDEPLAKIKVSELKTKINNEKYKYCELKIVTSSVSKQSLVFTVSSANDFYLHAY